VSCAACAAPPPDPPIAADVRLVAVIAFDRSSFDRPTAEAPWEFRGWTDNPAGWALHFDLSSHEGLRFGNPVYWDRWNKDKKDREFMSYAAEAYDCDDPGTRYEPSRIILPGYMPGKEGPPTFGPITADGDPIYAVYLRPPTRSPGQSVASSPPTTPDVCLRVIGTRRDGRTAYGNEVRIPAASIEAAVRIRKIVAPAVGPTLRLPIPQVPRTVVGPANGPRPDPGPDPRPLP